MGVLCERLQRAVIDLYAADAHYPNYRAIFGNFSVYDKVVSVYGNAFSM